MPAVTDSKSTASMSSKKENSQSEATLSELLAKLSISKEADQVKEASHNIAVFINGDIETKDAPTK